MITRPLDLASRLQPEPRNFDAFFWVNVGLVALFFTLFGSSFVVAPGIDLPVISGARASGIRATTVLKVRASGQLLTDRGLLPDAQLLDWLKQEVLRAQKPVLLIEADRRAATGEITHIGGLARRAGFTQVLLAVDEPVSSNGEGG
jgi:biopolymer transport protein ExbD